MSPRARYAFAWCGRVASPFLLVIGVIGLVTFSVIAFTDHVVVALDVSIKAAGCCAACVVGALFLQRYTTTAIRRLSPERRHLCTNAFPVIQAREPGPEKLG